MSEIDKAILSKENTERFIENNFDPEHIHGFFGLSYANYLVIPRSVLQSMPQKWQVEFVQLLNELDADFSYLEWPHYNVRVLKGHPEFQLHYEKCPACDGNGITEDGDDECQECFGSGVVGDDDPRYDTPEEVGFKDDPIPHYDRGRTKLVPRERSGP